MNLHANKNRSELQRLLEFTDEDLVANRQGYMTKKQRGMLAEKRRSWNFIKALTLLVAIILVLSAYWDGVLRNDTPASQLGIIGLIGIVAGLSYAYGIIVANQLSQDLSKGEVAEISGEIQRQFINLRGGMQGILINKSVFRVTEQVSYFLNDNHTYRLYYTPYSKIILSAERVS